MNERQAMIISIAVLVVLVLGGGGAWYYTEFHTLAALAKEIKNLQKQKKESEEKVAKLPGLQAENKSLEAEIAVLQTKIPRLNIKGFKSPKGEWIFEYDELAKLLDDKRRKANVHVPAGRFTVMPRTAGPGQPQLPMNVHKVAYDFNVRGGWFNLLRYINMLESENRVLAIESFSIVPSGQDEAGSVPKRELTVRVVSYTYRDPDQPPESPDQLLMKLKATKDPNERDMISRSLREHGPAAIPALEAAATDPDADYAAAARGVLDSIRPTKPAEAMRSTPPPD